MQGEVSTLGAPIMLFGLLAGFFLCFYGYTAKPVWIRLRSVVSGSLVAVTLALVFHDMPRFSESLLQDQPLRQLWFIIFDTSDYRRVLLYLLSFSLGGLSLYLLSRIHSKAIELVMAFFAALSMALFLFFLLISLVPLPYSLGLTALFLVVIMAFSLTRFDSYLALESALSGSLLVSYLLYRFWYLSPWLFFTLWAFLAFLGIINQMHMLSRRNAVIKEVSHG